MSRGSRTAAGSPARDPNGVTHAAHQLLLATLFLGALAGCTRADPSAMRVVVITLDTTRADHLSGWGYSRATSPDLDRLIAGGVRFASAYTPTPTTDPAHTTLFTGLHPRSHGILANGMSLPDGSLPNLFRWAKAKGWATAGIVSRTHVNPRALNLDGVDFDSGPSERERRGDETLQVATEWISQHRKEPFLLWVHFFDPHGPYDPPADFEAPWLDRGNARQSPEDLVDLYDAEILYADSVIGRFVEVVEALPTLGRETLYVFANDHGETLTELQERFDYAFDHGEFLYEGQIHVGLALRWDGHLPAERIVTDPVGLVDVAATVTELVDGEPAWATEGVSLAHAIRGGSTVERGPLFFERKHIKPKAIEEGPPAYQGDHLAVRLGRWKYLEMDGFPPELYDVEADPRELQNVAGEHPDIVARLSSEIARWKAGHETRELPMATDEKVIEDLKALGYLQ